MSMLPSVFVSYARTDSDSIQYAVGLLEAGGAEVFRDIDDIGFGDRWEEVITERIQGCERVLVFWSKAAAQSEWVGREYRMALQLGKKLVPVLLDNTPLPSDLGAFHALTLSSFMPKTSRLKRYGGWVLGGVATTALVGVLGMQLFSNSYDENKTSAIASAPQSAPTSKAAGTVSDVISGNTSSNTNVGESLNYRQQSGAQSAAAVAKHEIVPMSAPTPMGMLVEPAEGVANSTASESSVHTESNVSNNAHEAMEESGAAPSAEGMNLNRLLPWIIGILALLSLCWLALRRYGKRNRSVDDSGERFVEMVFDERAAVTNNH